MFGQIPPTNEEPSVHLQVEVDRAITSQHARLRKRSLPFQIGFVFAGFMLMGFSAWVFVLLSSDAESPSDSTALSTRVPKFAYNPQVLLKPGVLHRFKHDVKTMGFPDRGRSPATVMSIMGPEESYNANHIKGMRDFQRPATEKVPLESTPARLLVLAPLVPGQRFSCKSAFGEVPRSFIELVQRSAEPLVAVGRNSNSLFERGVEVVGQTEGDDVVIEATGRWAKILESGDDEGSRWAGRTGKVQWLGRLEDNDYLLSTDDAYMALKAIDHAGYLGNEENPESFERKGVRLAELVNEWIGLAQAKDGDELSRQLTGVLQNLGPMPATLNQRAFYVAALINSQFAREIARDIRPAVITTDSTSRRLSVAEEGILDSIKRVKESFEY